MQLTTCATPLLHFTKKVKNVTASMFIVQHVRELKNEIEIGATIFVWTTRQLVQ